MEIRVQSDADTLFSLGSFQDICIAGTAHADFGDVGDLPSRPREYRAGGTWHSLVEAAASRGFERQDTIVEVLCGEFQSLTDVFGLQLGILRP